MSKKNKFLASSLAGLNIVGMAASTSSNTVKAFNLTEFLLNFLGKSELFRKLFSSLYTGLNEYKYSDIVLDSLGYTHLAVPAKEGETVECNGVTLVATKIGGEKSNILMWRAQSKTKPGKAVYLCDQQTWEDKILTENAPEYVDFFLEKFRRKSTDNIKVLTENGFDGILNRFKENVKQAKYLVEIEELLSSKNFEDIQYDEFWDYAGELGLPRPENIGDKIAIVKSEGLKKLKENEDYLNGKIGAYFSNYLENEDFYELTALKINGKWCWVYCETTASGKIKKMVCLHLGGEKPTGDKTPVINLDEKKLLEVLPGFEPY